MAALTQAQRNIADAMINKTFASLGASSTGWAKPGAGNGGFVERAPSPGPRSPYMTAAEQAKWNETYGPKPVPTTAPVMTAALPPPPRPRPGYAPTVIDMAAINAPPPAGMPVPPAVAAELDVMPPRPATQAIPPNLQAILAQNPMASGFGMQSPAQILANSIPKAEAYNRTRKAGMTDWATTGGGTVYSKSLHDKVTSRAGTGSPSASKTAGGRARDKYGNPL